MLSRRGASFVALCRQHAVVKRGFGVTDAGFGRRMVSTTRYATAYADYEPGQVLRPEYNNALHVIGAPFHHGQPIPGTDKGPHRLRHAEMTQHLLGIGWNVTDQGDVEMEAARPTDPQLSPDLGRAKNSYVVGRSMNLLRHKVRESAKTGSAVLTLGGDHSIAIGSISGMLEVHPRIGVVWVDAHADINTPDTTPSGNIHGMPLGYLIEGLMTHSQHPGFEWMSEVPRLRPEQLVFVGLRDVDPGEIALIRKLGITAYTMTDIDRHGIGEVMERALQQLHGRPLHLSYDIDALDPMLAPATGTMVPGGLSFREAHYVGEKVYSTERLVSMDMVEVNPDLSDDVGVKKTVEMAVDITKSSLGKVIL